MNRQPRHRACDAYNEVAEGCGHKRSADGSSKHAAAGFIFGSAINFSETKFLCIILALSALACADHHEASPQVLIEAEYNQYTPDFIAKDYEAIASHLNQPIRQTTFEGSLVLETREEIVAMYQNTMANIQEGYSYREIDSIDIHAMSSTAYAEGVKFTCYNTGKETVFGRRSIYLSGKQSGA